MTDEKITIGELGAYTNNSPNKEGLKKLVDKVNTPGVDAYTKTETDALLDDKQDVLTAGSGITIENDVISATGSGSEWKIVNTNDWVTEIADVDSTNYKIKFLKDVFLVVANKDINSNGTFYFPKNSTIPYGNGYKFILNNFDSYGIDETLTSERLKLSTFSFKWKDVFNTTSSVSLNVKGFVLSYIDGEYTNTATSNVVSYPKLLTEYDRTQLKFIQLYTKS